MIEGTSPPNSNNSNSKNSNVPNSVNTANIAEGALGQKLPNVIQSKDNSTSQKKDTIESESPRLENKIVHADIIEPHTQNELIEQERNIQKDSNEMTDQLDTNTGKKGKLEKRTENIDDIESKLKDIDNNEGNKDANVNNNQSQLDNIYENNINVDGNENEKKVDNLNNDNENIDNINDEKKIDCINNINNDNENIDNINNDYINNDYVNNISNNDDDEKKEENNNQNDETRKEMNELEDNDSNHLNFPKDEKSSLSSSHNANSIASHKSSFDNRSISFYLSTPDPKDVQDSLDSLINHKIQPTEQLRDPVMQLINKKKLDALMERDYDLAEKYDQTAEILQKNGDDLLFERNERIRKLTIDDRSESISEKINNVKQKYNKKIEDLKTERKSSIEGLQAQQENENAAFRQKWQDPNFLSKYKRPSQELLQLRLTEKKLALSKFYDEAKEKKIWADKQQKIEEKQAQTAIESEMKKDFFRMKDNQYMQLKKLSDHYDQMIKSLEFQRNKEIQSMEYALKQMEIKKNTVPNRKLHTIPADLCQMNNGHTDTSLTAKMSPRTMSRLAQFRNEKKGNINVSPIADSTFSKLISAHPIIRPPSKFKVNNRPASKMRRL